MLMTNTLDAEKAKVREFAKAERKRAAAELGRDASVRFADHLLRAVGPQMSGMVLSGYLEIGDELSVSMAMERHRANGGQCVLPVVTKAEALLDFRQWSPGCEFEDGPFRTRHPVAGSPELTPQILLVPLLAFDAEGYRIGWGGGFYDRTLSHLRDRGEVIAVGAAYSAQRVDRVPRDRHDQPLDWVITEREAIQIRRAGQR